MCRPPLPRPLLRLAERARSLGAHTRRLGQSLRPFPDPLAALWRLAESRWALPAVAAGLAAVAASALAVPGLYLLPGNAPGLAPGAWPGAAARLAALSLLAAQPWGFAALALCLLVAAVHGAGRLAPMGAAGSDAGPAAAAERTLIYSDRPLASVRRRVHVLAAVLGYRWLPGEQTVTLDRASTRRACAAAAALCLALVACLLLVWPRVSAVEVVALVEGDSAALSLASGSVLVSQPAGGAQFVLRTASGDVLAAPAIAGTWSAAGVSIVRHGSGPALLVRPGASPLSGNADVPGTVAIGFSAANASQLVTVPGIGKTIRVSLVRDGPLPAFDVQLVDDGGAPVGTSYLLDTPAVLTLSGVSLAFRPTSYDALSLWRAPLALPLMLALTLAVLATALAVAYRGPALVLAMRASGPVVGVELSAVAGSPRPSWLPLLRLLLR